MRKKNTSHVVWTSIKDHDVTNIAAADVTILTQTKELDECHFDPILALDETSALPKHHGCVFNILWPYVACCCG